MPRLSVACVILQRVPPDIRILTPGLRFFSKRRVRRPRPAARKAATSPAAPAPITPTSQNAPAMSTPLPAAVRPLFALDLLQSRGRRLAHVRAVVFPLGLPQNLDRRCGRRPEFA